MIIYFAQLFEREKRTTHSIQAFSEHSTPRVLPICKLSIRSKMSSYFISKEKKRSLSRFCAVKAVAKNSPSVCKSFPLHPLSARVLQMSQAQQCFPGRFLEPDTCKDTRLLVRFMRLIKFLACLPYQRLGLLKIFHWARLPPTVLVEAFCLVSGGCL